MTLFRHSGTVWLFCMQAYADAVVSGVRRHHFIGLHVLVALKGPCFFSFLLINLYFWVGVNFGVDN